MGTAAESEGARGGSWQGRQEENGRLVPAGTLMGMVRHWGGALRELSATEGCCMRLRWMQALTRAGLGLML